MILSLKYSYVHFSKRVAKDCLTIVGVKSSGINILFMGKETEPYEVDLLCYIGHGRLLNFLDKVLAPNRTFVRRDIKYVAVLLIPLTLLCFLTVSISFLHTL